MLKQAVIRWLLNDPKRKTATVRDLDAATVRWLANDPKRKRDG